MDIQEEDDEIFFTPQTSTNLATLFNSSMMKNATDRQVSLVYKAPKQPNITPKDNIINPNQVTSKARKPQSSVICFREIHSFKHINDSIQTLGKCGLALIGNEEHKMYQLLIYKQKTNILSSTKIHTNFEFAIQKNNHASLTDDKNVYWSIQFYTEDDMKAFARTLSQKCECKIKNEDNIDFMSDNIVMSKVISDEKNDKMPTDTKPVIHMKGDGIDELKTNQKENIIKDNNESPLINKDTILSKVAKIGQKLITEQPDNNPEQLNKPEVNTSHQEDISLALTQKQLNQFTSQLTGGNTSIGSLFPNQNMLLQQTSIHSASSSVSDAINLLFVENRIHNSEFRMSIMKLQTSVDSILNTFQHSDDKQKTEEKLRNDNKKLQLILAKQKETMISLKSSLELYKKRNEDLMKSEAEHSLHLAALAEDAARTACEDHKRNMDLKDLEIKNEDLNKKIKEYNQQLESIQQQLKNSIFIKSTEVENLHSIIKDIMNGFFDQTCESFKISNSYDAHEIHKALAPMIIDVTYKILSAIQQKCIESKITIE